MIFIVVLKFLKHSTFVLMFIKLFLMVREHCFNFLSINLVKLHKPILPSSYVRSMQICIRTVLSYF